MCSPDCNDEDMEASKVRTRRSVAEKRRIVELTFEPGQSVARVALAEGVNSHQVFQWRRAYRKGELTDGGEHSMALLPVVMATAGCEDVGERQKALSLQPASSSGAIHIEMAGRATISVESGADAALLRTILESLRK
jgi:transposase